MMGSAPLEVQFTDRSTGATEYNWDFGDGANSTEENPVHVYIDPGTYTVNLTVVGGSTADSAERSIRVW